jgi:ubiquinone/menaquinone biosynthesis C-methylase UbiE
VASEPVQGQARAWEAVAERWARLVRRDTPHDDNLEAFLELLPPPGRALLDLGCGEGRLSRRLSPLGYRVVGIDASPTLVRLAREADPVGDYRVADASVLPLDDASFDLVVAFMSLQDMDDSHGAVREAARVLESGGRLCISIIHPLWSAAEVDESGGRLTIRRYLATIPHVRPVMRVPSVHRPLEAYFGALEAVGLLVEALRELPAPDKLASAVPVFLHLRAVKP